MTTHEPRVIDTVVTAYRDIGRVLTSMLPFVLVTLLLLTVCNVVEQLISPTGPRESLTAGLINFAFSIVSAFLLTPFLIAVHRFILLDEITATYRLDLRTPRFWRFFVWSVALAAMIMIPALLMSAEGLASTALIAALFIAAVYVTVRFTILFPAIAIDAPGAADYLRAFSDTKGQVWRIILILLLALLPFSVLMIVVLTFGNWLADLSQRSFGPSMIFSALMQSVLSLLLDALLVAIASRLFQALADRVLQPPNGSVTIRP